MVKPLLIIVNGLPASGKTTLANRLGSDLSLPVLSRDAIYETLRLTFELPAPDQPDPIGPASFNLLYQFTKTVLAAGQSLIIEQYFGRPDIRSAELLQIQQHYDYHPFQILCRADGQILLDRFLTRTRPLERYTAQYDTEWLERNKKLLLQGQIAPLTLGGDIVEVDTTTPDTLDYANLLRHIGLAIEGLTD